MTRGGFVLFVLNSFDLTFPFFVFFGWGVFLFFLLAGWDGDRVGFSLMNFFILRDLVLMCGRGVGLRDEEGDEWTGVCESDGDDE